ncbi:hypothetical protein EVAR_44244_1 [Eumeta japonica]|uniref:Uncharacterized protein n=1 Tax=Eumeta variegata TaxID=151549 RepID=A0A4C1XCZ7_EUMVA|nr:hypothetical protein EVAR_44244_1 [Eumeta japonica]
MQKIEIHISALENTWSNQRRKRRLMERIKELDKKKAKICKGDEEPLLNSTIIDTNMDSDKNVTDNDTKEENNAASLHKKHREGQSSFNIMNADTKSENETSMLQNIKKKPSSMSDVDAIESENNTTNLHNKRKRTSCNIRCSKTSCSVNGIEEQSSTTDENSILNLGTAIHNNNQIEQPSFQAAKADVDVQSMYEPTQPIVQGIIKLIKANSVIILELEYLTGSGGKESIHQILQYIKNNWK